MMDAAIVTEKKQIGEIQACDTRSTVNVKE